MTRGTLYFHFRVAEGGDVKKALYALNAAQFVVSIAHDHDHGPGLVGIEASSHTGEADPSEEAQRAVRERAEQALRQVGIEPDIASYGITIGGGGRQFETLYDGELFGLKFAIGFEESINDRLDDIAATFSLDRARLGFRAINPDPLDDLLD